MDSVTITKVDPNEFSLFENLPSDLIKLLIVKTQYPIVFSVHCKLFNSYSKDEDFWKNYASIVSQSEFPPKHFNQDPRFATSIPVSWRAYCRRRIDYHREWKTLLPGSNRRLLVSFSCYCNITVVERNTRTAETGSIWYRCITNRSEQYLSLVRLHSRRSKPQLLLNLIIQRKTHPTLAAFFTFDLQIPKEYPFKPPKVSTFLFCLTFRLYLPPKCIIQMYMKDDNALIFFIPNGYRS